MTLFPVFWKLQQISATQISLKLHGSICWTICPYNFINISKIYVHLVSYGVCAPGIGDCKQLMHDECCPYSLVWGLARLLTTTTFQMGLSPSFVATSPLPSTENDEVNLCLFSLKPITYPCLQLLCQNNIRKSSWETSEAGRQRKKLFWWVQRCSNILDHKDGFWKFSEMLGAFFSQPLLKIQGGPICDTNSNENESTGIKWSVFSCTSQWYTEEY